VETAPSTESPFYEPAAGAQLSREDTLETGGVEGPRRERAGALLEVLLCSGVPTQLLIGQVLALGGWSPFTRAGVPQAGPLFALALIDTLVLLALIAALQRARGETMGGLLLGGRSIRREAWFGVALVPALFLAVGVTVLTLRQLFPWLHNVPANPFEQLIRTPRDAGLFSIVAIVAGGLREEVQRAFLLRRFSTHLGGPTVGLAVVSVAFGAGHIVQGFDAAVATGMLGFVWGLMYLRRGSAVGPIVSHALYNGTQVLQLMLVRSVPL
jgi:membrane protease YdiL (CAAX protease family)